MMHGHKNIKFVRICKEYDWAQIVHWIMYILYYIFHTWFFTYAWFQASAAK